MAESKKEYDATKFDRPSVTADLTIFTIKHSELQVLLVKRKVWPFKDKWALPGGFVHMDEDLEQAAYRELREETGVKDVYLEQLYTFGNPKRDPRTRVITVAYFALMRSEGVKLKAATDVIDARWFPAYDLPQLAFDHNEILKYALQRLKWKLEYTTVAFQLLPKKFTLTQLQKVYETVLNKKFDKRNFRKKINSLDLIKETNEYTEDVAHRPARLYTCKKKIGDIVEIL
ncbi:NUDIX hydrolase [Candidatus Woesearchaeota archaeon]|nr:NUDIX hydrolase [Candidatus Woesearchaeota archaeon]MBW3014419.1 NUDIX hydrolase [Candidatus Woesearchaeota archaeon]